MEKVGSEVVSTTTQLKILAPDGKKHLSNMLYYSGIIALGKTDLLSGLQASKIN